jgi:hypothetical protein
MVVRPRQWVKLCSVLWAAYAGLVFLWSARGGSFGDTFSGPLVLLGVCVSLATGLGSGLLSMEMVRLNSLQTGRAILAVLIPSVVSAIGPPIILVIIPPCFGFASVKEAVLAAAVQAFITVLFGIVNFLSFSFGILCLRSKGKEGPECSTSQ